MCKVRREVRNLDVEQCCLQGVEAKIAAYVLVMILAAGTVNATSAGFGSEDVIVGGQKPAITKAAKVLRGEKTVGSEIAKSTDLLVVVGRAKGLGAVLDDVKIMGTSEIEQWAHCRRLTKEMHWENGLGFFCDAGLSVVGIEIETYGADVTEHWCGPCAGDTTSSSKEGERRAKHFIAGANP